MSEVSVVSNGYLSLVLHAHMPYVRDGERDDRLEERWVYEAMLESYIPLLLVFEKLLADGIPFRITLAVSPPLLSMLDDPLIRERFRRHLAKTVELAGKECKRTSGSPEEHRVAKMYLQRFREIAQYCRKWDYALVSALKRLQESGCVELITCAATHAFLPFVETEEAIRAQLMVGIDTHERILGRRPAGIWLPECGYTPGLDRLLKEAGIRYFFTDSHTVRHATPHPRRGLFAPLLTPYDVAAFPRDEEASRQVWSSVTGYPGDYDYREYYRDIGFDLDWAYIAPYVHPQGFRVHTGLKYHRITGRDEPKAIYDPDRAREKADVHAGHFLASREAQVVQAAEWLDRPALITATYDAELFGHWWYEGPQFLDFLLRKAACDSHVISLTTPSAYMDACPQIDRGRLPMSSWGRNGYGEVWLNERNSWIYRHLHQAERDLIELVEKTHDDHEARPLLRRGLQQAARELMLAQSSDWAFIMDGQTVVDYAVRRTHDHLTCFRELVEQIEAGTIDPERLAAREQAYPLFPDLDLRYYLPISSHRVNVSRQYVAAGSERQEGLRVLMLSWEFPPRVVGGLGRAVYDLACHLARQHAEVHVLTASPGTAAHSELVNGVCVHWLNTYVPGEQSDFLDWVFQLNLAMTDAAERLVRQGFRPDLIHAHDWMVGWAALELKQRWERPLVTTIHALEHGRHQGIHTPLQQRIHEREQLLSTASDRLIVCSRYMAGEVNRLFGVPHECIAVIPNGVACPPAATADEAECMRVVREELGLGTGPVIFFVGRMVREKGVHLLLEAAPRVLHEHPEAVFVLAGKGPMLEEWRQMAEQRGLASRVRFLGFVDDDRRNLLFRMAAAAVFPSLYEPFGIVALEAMALGTPVIVADTGGLREIVRHGENGLTFYTGNANSLADQLCWLLHCPDERERLVRTAREDILCQYDWNRLALQTMDLYRSLGSAWATSI